LGGFYRFVAQFFLGLNLGSCVVRWSGLDGLIAWCLMTCWWRGLRRVWQADGQRNVMYCECVALAEVIFADELWDGVNVHSAQWVDECEQGTVAVFHGSYNQIQSVVSVIIQMSGF
jgi:hypothetical protein